ncbi:MAG: AAA family ATPase [Bacilli bacterium]|nr:AAA family ATPase [Bacilli bacterium]
MKFNFNWKGKGFDKVPPNVIEVAKKLLELNLVKVEPDLDDSGSVVIRHCGVCKTQGLVESISVGLTNDTTHFYKFTSKLSYSIDGVCEGRKDSKVVSCKMSTCPILVAGYLYYQANKDESDAEVVGDVTRELTDAEKQERNLNELKNMNLDEEIEELLTPLAMPTIRGLRIAFVGEEGTNKEETLKKMAAYLYRIGKISEDHPRVRTLTAIGDKDFEFNNNALYSIEGIQDFLDIMANNDDFSANAEQGRKGSKSSIRKIVQAKNKYLVINTTPLEFKKFLATDPKLPYVFDETIYFKDFEDEELLRIFEKNLPEYHKNLITPEIKTNFLSYLERNRKYFPFKNAELSVFLSSYVSRKMDLLLPKERYDNSTLDSMFANIIGMKNVKDQIYELHSFLDLRNKLEKQGVQLPDFNLHMLFLGSPGTGKTMVARLIAKILFDLGYIKENKCVEVETKDLIAAYTGQTAMKTSRVINSAIGGVLFIDEAYSLANGSSFGLESIATIVKAMEDNKGELVVIFAGYSKEMQEFIDSNSGIKSRIGYTFEFADYSEEELYKIYELKASKTGFKIDQKAEAKIRELINYGRTKKNFGNGRYVDNIFQKTLTKHAKNIKSEDDVLIIKEDSVPSIEDVIAQASGNKDPKIIDKLFDDIIGLDNIKKQVIELGKYINFRNEMSKLHETRLPDMRLHMLFTGESGTGKTLMARKITEMLYNIGCIRINKLVEVGRKDLVAEYIGQTAPKTQRVIDGAMGGVLFIDEAYALVPKDTFRDFGLEAIATLIKAMDDNKDDLVVIFAGYKKEMKEFINVNSGIASRIGYTFDFENYKDEELYKIFELKCNKFNLEISEEVKTKVMELLKYFSSVDNFGNGRFVDKLLQEILIKHASSYKEGDKVNLLSIEDIPSIKEVIEKTFNNKDNLVIPSDITPEARRQIAIHEIGHAIINYLYQGETNLKVITVVPEGSGALGYVLHSTPKTKVLWTKRDYLDEVEELLAGRAAEELYLGKEKISSGCSSDLEKASSRLNQCFSEFGMSETLGLISTRGDKPNLEMLQKLDIEKRNVLESCYQNVLRVLKENEYMFNKILGVLMEKGTLTGEEFVALIKEN